MNSIYNEYFLISSSWIASLYTGENPYTGRNPEEHLTPEGKMLWRQYGEKIKHFITQTLGDDFIRTCYFSDSIEYEGEDKVVITFMEPLNTHIQVGQVTLRAIKLPMIKRKGEWLIDLARFVEQYWNNID
jgi:hypothetical protein